MLLGEQASDDEPQWGSLPGYRESEKSLRADHPHRYSEALYKMGRRIRGAMPLEVPVSNGRPSPSRLSAKTRGLRSEHTACAVALLRSPEHIGEFAGVFYGLGSQWLPRRWAEKKKDKPRLT